MEILCIGEESYIIDLEVKAIIAYGSIENGYNLTLGNPRTGALSLAPETRQRISDSLNKYYSENIAWNSGIIIGRRKEYDPHYVCGFWFPHLEDACSALNLKVTQLHKWRREGTLGDTHRPRKDSLEKPLYVAGFWFDTITRASLKLSLDRKTVFKRVRDGNVEERQRPKGQKPEDCHMNGKTGFLHHNSKAIEIHGVVYGSIAEASRESGFTKKVIYNRLKNNTPGFSWYIEKQEEI
jgi:hypothetical protein